MDLNQLRQDIDKIDTDIASLFIKRMEIAAAVAQFKKENDLPVFHPDREKEVLNKVCSFVPPHYNNPTKLLFQTIMDISKSLQSLQLSDISDKNSISSYKKSSKKINPSVVCQGVSGAYSQKAAEVIFKDCNPSFVESFDDVFKMVDSGDFDYGVLPIENSSAGSVTNVYDLMKKYNFYISDAVKLTINHALLAKKGTKFEDITEVYSHEQALNQCNNFFKENKKIHPIAFKNTALSAKLVSESNDTNIAAIASPECATLYNLEIIKFPLQNSQINQTRFICISKTPEIKEDADKISIALTIPHVTGSLYRILTIFAVNNLNLTKLESRPIPDKNFEFMFYFDFEGNVFEESVAKLFSELSTTLPYFQFLGNYKEIEA